MKRFIFFSLTFFLTIQLNAQKKVRQPVDTIGFATKTWQIDSVIKRIHGCYDTYYDSINKLNYVNAGTSFRLSICPHDDYTYAGYLYESLAPYIRAKTVIIFGVAHQAKKYKIEQKLVFDSFDEWKEPYGNITVSYLRNEIMKKLPEGMYVVHDSLQQSEHSVEAIVPFLQYHRRDVQIVPVLVPYMSFDMMNKYARQFAAALAKVMEDNKLIWGNDIALVISNDAVHYGDEDWGGKNYASYGCDSAGYEKAVNHEKKIIDNSLLPVLDTASIHKFFNYTVQPENWREYRWPWCGRYSVPFGLMAGMYLSEITADKKLAGVKMGYSTSITRKPLPVDDLQMGKTAIATLHHWVGYAAIGYK
ncbi:MAG: AmmeMemoRadiSam system protein B [Bacteroidota bacterium]